MPQLAGARAREYETKLGPLLHKAVNHIQQLGRLLHLVDHHGGEAGLLRGDPLP